MPLAARRTLLAPVAVAAFLAGAAAGYLATALLAPSAEPRSTGAAAIPARASEPAGKGLEPALALPAAEGARAPAAAGERVASVSPAELERALAAASVAATPVAAARGASAITGTVRDESGAPLTGVAVIAERRLAAAWEDAGDVGSAPPDEASLEKHLRAAAADWAEERAYRRRSTSGADGVYRFDGLDRDASYRVRAYLAGAVLTPEGPADWVAPPRRLDFRAAAAHAVPVELVLPGGAHAGAGVVEVRRAQRATRYAWSAGAPVLRLTTGRVELRGHAEVFAGESTPGEVVSAYASAWVPVDVPANAGAPERLELAPRTGIRGRLVDPAGLARGVRAHLMALGADAEPNLGALAATPPAWLGGDRFHFLDLAPGTYAVGVDEPGGSIFAHDVVAVTGLVAVELVVPSPDPEHALLVRALDPAGRVLEDVAFFLRRNRDGGVNFAQGLAERRAPDGAWWLLPPADFFAPWPPGDTYELVASHDAFGQVTVALAPGQREVAVRFAEPAALVVAVEGYAGSGYEGRLYASVGSASTDLGVWQWQARHGRAPLDAAGVVRHEGLAPGDWTVALLARVGSHEWRPAQIVDVALAAGERTVRLDLPVLHTVTVVAPGIAEGSYLSLRSDGDNRAGVPFAAQTQVDAEHRAAIAGLVAGRYALTGPGIAEPILVAVPCGEVHVDVREPDALRVAIADPEGAFAVAGLRAGDLIVGADGRRFGSHAELEHHAAGSGEAALLVLREGVELVVPVPRALLAAGAASGGVLTPALAP